MSKIRVGIVGPGKVAHLHAKAIQSQCEHATLVGVCGRSLERSATFAQQYGAEAFEDIPTMVSSAQVEAVIVCTPHAYHREPVVEAAKLGVHCLIEKPMASSLEDCDAMIKAAAAGNAKLAVISQRRWYEPMDRMKSAIEEGKIGVPALAHVIMLGWRDEAYYNSDPWRGKWETEGGGVLINQAPHQLDLFLWLMGPIDRLYAVTRNLNHPYIEVEDSAVVVAEFKSGAVGNIVVSNSQKPGIYGKVHVHGSNGASVGAQIEGGSMFIAGRTSVQEPPYNDLWTIPGEESSIEKWRKDDEAFFQTIDATSYYIGLQIDDFCRALKEDTVPSSSGAEGRNTVELITAIYLSHQEGKPIQFPVVGDDPISRLTTFLPA